MQRSARNGNPTNCNHRVPRGKHIIGIFCKFTGTSGHQALGALPLTISQKPKEALGDKTSDGKLLQ